MKGEFLGMVGAANSKSHEWLQAQTLPRVSGLCLVLVLGLVFGTTAAAAITLEKLQEAEPVFDWIALEEGEVVTKDLPDDELDAAELVAVVGVKVNASVSEVLEHLEDEGDGLYLIGLDFHVGYLRRKLEQHGTPRLIETVRGVGFTIRAPDAVA